ncbi:hypothetical protein YC2023_060198 [Brassica napus]
MSIKPNCKKKIDMHMFFNHLQMERYTSFLSSMILVKAYFDTGATSSILKPDILSSSFSNSCLVPFKEANDERNEAEDEHWHELARPQVHGHDINFVVKVQDKDTEPLLVPEEMVASLRIYKKMCRSFVQICLLLVLSHKLIYLYRERLTTRKNKFNEGGFPREFVVKEALRGISEETRFVVTHSS